MKAVHKPYKNANAFSRTSVSVGILQRLKGFTEVRRNVRNKNNIPRTCEMQNGEEHAKEKNSHDTKFTWFITWATSTELQRSFTIKQGDYKGGMKTLSQTQTPNTPYKLFVLKNNNREIFSLFFFFSHAALTEGQH